MKMRNTIVILVISTFVITILTSCRVSKASFNSDKYGIEVKKAFKKVYDVTQEVLFEEQVADLEIESIDLAFTTSTSTDVNLGVKLWVVSGKYQRTKSNSKKVTFTFGKNDSKPAKLTEDTNMKVFKDYLIAVIKGSKDIEKGDSFGLKEIEVEVEFIIRKSLVVEGEIEILPVTPSIGGNREKENAHTITIKFRRT